MKNLKRTLMIMIFLIPLADLAASESIGKYTDGVLRDSLDLDRTDYGMQSMRRSRNAYHGHDYMIEFLKDVAALSFTKGNGQLLVSDISGEEGGWLAGHASHQIGLDVDIWFWRPDDTQVDLPDSMRENFGAPIYLDPMTNKFLKNQPWDEKLDQVFKDIALDSRVGRIFVNPGVKMRLCQKFPQQRWLRKIRPWWRHHEHLHVRLNCPADSPRCEKQPIPAEIECDSPAFLWWFSDDFKDEYRRRYGKAMISGDYPICDVP